MSETEAGHDGLVLWCSENFEHNRDAVGLSLLQRVIPLYRDASPAKPIFYAPVNSRDLSRLYTMQPAGIMLVADDKLTFQDSTWQLDEIRRLVRAEGLKTIEVIGMQPCIAQAAERISGGGVTVTARYNDGRRRIFEESPIEFVRKILAELGLSLDDYR